MALINRIAGVSFTDTSIAKLVRDPAIVAGTLLLLDFKDLFCWPEQDPPEVNDSLVNLVEGGATGSAKISTPTFSGGGFITTNGSGPLADLGTGYSFQSGTPDFCATIWIKQHPTAADTTAFARLFGCGNGTSEAPWFFDAGADGNTIRVGNGNLQVANVGSLVSGQVTQVGLSNVVSGGNRIISAYKNGALVSTATVTGTTLPAPTVGTGIGRLGANTVWKGAYYRCMVENLTASGRSALAAIQSDYAVGAARGFA